MTRLSHQLNQQNNTSGGLELNGFIENSPIYVTSYPPAAGPEQEQRKEEESKRSEEEIELKQELQEELHSQEDLHSQEEEEERSGGRRGVRSRRVSSEVPSHNGGTEVLLVRDTRSVSSSSPPAVHRPHLPDRGGVRGGVGGDVKERLGPAETTPVMTHPTENGPHREMPIDVPDSFMPSNKTPPRYPPPRPHQGLNGVGKPVPVPRTDGGRPPAPAPVPPPALNNNQDSPTKQQLDSINKYQEQLRRRREEEERAAQAQELLNRSLRGSKKLQALESNRPVSPPAPAGLENGAFALDEPLAPSTPAPQPSPLYRHISYGEVVGCLQRVCAAVKKQGSGLEAEVGAVQSLLLTPRFTTALATYNKLLQVSPLPAHAQPVTDQAHLLVTNLLDSWEGSGVAEVAELTDILTRFEVEGLLYSHDTVARSMPPAEPPARPTPQPSPRHHSPHHPSSHHINIVKIEKTNEPLGATVRNEGDAVMIGRIVRGGAADKCGLLHEGDEVLEVNGVEMRGKSVNEVCDLLASMTGTLAFLIVPHHPSQPPTPHRDSLVHVKANFDYDPEEDLYIPCRELGISFQKGDILHVISQEDPNWWQAFREGEDDQTLAGLIPSRSFHYQRESVKQAISGDKLSREKSRKAGTFLCAKKNTKKKKKKYAGYDGGYPMYATTTDEFEDEILTYDEVALYYPRASHKRPIVLIGPPNIGRHELRQRLMEDSDRFAAAVPHTSRSRKDGEVDGQDYHFITRAQFEADILARKFVEHGEYEKAYYGTSLDAIRAVVAAGKICVLNLHPQSLRILRSSDLKPYVVFVAPPSLEKLRQKKIRNGEAFKEEELKDIIEKAREMEDKYGHYFDMIINNNDTERAYHQLLNEINVLEREPQWVPAAWLRTGPPPS